MCVVTLVSCKKSGTIEFQVNETRFTSEYEYFKEYEPDKYRLEDGNYDVISIVPGTYSIEYYPSKTCYDTKVTMKYHLNKQLKVLDNVELKDVKYDVNPWLCFFDADDKSPINSSMRFFGPISMDPEAKALEMDNVQEWIDFLTSPVGTEKELTVYGDASGDELAKLKTIVSVAIKEPFISYSSNRVKVIAQ